MRARRTPSQPTRAPARSYRYRRIVSTPISRSSSLASAVFGSKPTHRRSRTTCSGWPATWRRSRTTLSSSVSTSPTRRSSFPTPNGTSRASRPSWRPSRGRGSGRRSRNPASDPHRARLAHHRPLLRPVLGDWARLHAARWHERRGVLPLRAADPVVAGGDLEGGPHLRRRHPTGRHQPHGQARNRRQLALVVHGHERHAHGLLLRAALAAGRRVDRRRGPDRKG